MRRHPHLRAMAHAYPFQPRAHVLALHPALPGHAQVIGALASILVIYLMTGILLWEATWRLIVPEVVDGQVMFWVALAGVVMNLILMQVLGASVSAVVVM